ncbi:MAG: iron-sulfur cluster assembly scaffold protein [Candidatus Aenigmarchaeota archaeon]|nr:iron-sulfur cluster assembly scaffold protein [Candidatus Aenigmarchaeota archaeon]
MSAEDIYQDIILEYYRNPVNFGHLSNPTIKAQDSNPLCGDQIGMELLVESKQTDTEGVKAVITDVRFYGKGCAISQASAGMLTEKIKNMTVEEASKLTRDDVLNMIGVELSPVRSKCALLSLKVMKLCAYQHLGKEMNEKI